MSETRSNNITEWPELPPWLTLTAAIVWGATRDEGLTMAAMGDSIIADKPDLAPLKKLSPQKIDLHRRRLVAEHPALLQVLPPPVDAGNELLRRFSSGRLVAYRQHIADKFHPMHHTEWFGARLTIASGEFDFFRFGKPVGRGWYVWLQRDDVLALWPPLPAQATAPPAPLAPPVPDPAGGDATAKKEPRKATTADLDRCIEALAAKADDGKTNRNTVRKEGPPWLREQGILASAKALEAQLKENIHRERRRSPYVRKDRRPRPPK
jgi:hypothetical protein